MCAAATAMPITAPAMIMIWRIQVRSVLAMPSEHARRERAANPSPAGPAFERLGERKMKGTIRIAPARPRLRHRMRPATLLGIQAFRLEPKEARPGKPKGRTRKLHACTKLGDDWADLGRAGHECDRRSRARRYVEISGYARRMGAAWRRAMGSDQAGGLAPAGAAHAGISGCIRAKPRRRGRGRAGIQSAGPVPAVRHAAGDDRLRAARAHHHAPSHLYPLRPARREPSHLYGRSRLAGQDHAELRGLLDRRMGRP